MPKFRPDPSARLKDIAEKQDPAKLKPIVGVHKTRIICIFVPEMVITSNDLTEWPVN